MKQPTIEDVRSSRASEVDRLAREIFKTDTCCDRDRKIYDTFDEMPLGLQEWWKDRAARRIRWFQPSR